MFFCPPQRHSGDPPSSDGHDQRDWRPSGGSVRSSLPLQGETCSSTSPSVWFLFVSLLFQLHALNGNGVLHAGGHGGGASPEGLLEPKLLRPARHLPADQWGEHPEPAGRAEGGDARIPDALLSSH